MLEAYYICMTYNIVCVLCSKHGSSRDLLNENLLNERRRGVRFYLLSVVCWAFVCFVNSVTISAQTWLCVALLGQAAGSFYPHGLDLDLDLWHRGPP